MASVGVLGFSSLSPTYENRQVNANRASTPLVQENLNSQKFEWHSRKLKLLQCTDGRQEGSPS